MEIKKQPYVKINRTNYLDEDGLDALWLKIKEYVALHDGGGDGIDLTKYTTKEELATELSKYYDRTEIDNLLSTINPDVDLSNYYTKEEVDGKIPTVPTKLSKLANDTNYLKYQVVSSLPEQQEEGVLYLATN